MNLKVESQTFPVPTRAIDKLRLKEGEKVPFMTDRENGYGIIFTPECKKNEITALDDKW